MITLAKEFTMNRPSRNYDRQLTDLCGSYLEDADPGCIRRMRFSIVLAVTIALSATVTPHSLLGADWPMLGRDATRNPVSPEAAPPARWDVESGHNVKWSAPLGSNSYGDPVVADGLVWVGTNNASLKPGEHRTDAAVLMCFRETDGELLYRYVSPRLPQGRVHDWPYGSLACSPLIEGNRMWFTTNRAEVVCLDIGPLHRGGGEPKTIWKLDMIEQLGVFPRGSIMNIARFCSPAAYKDWIYVITGNGVDESGIEVPRPDAPSLVCLEKATGRVVWTDNSPGENILHGQWASPLAAEIDGRAQVVAPQGDGWLRSFDAATGELICLQEFGTDVALPHRSRQPPLQHQRFSVVPVVRESGRVVLNMEL